MGFRRRARLIAAAAATLAGTLALVAAQAPQDVAGRLLAQPVSAPAIDRGVVDDGMPAGPRTGAAGGRTNRAAGDVGLPYVPGRVIVKFKSGGSATARASAASAAGARATARPTHADFDVLEIDPAADPRAVAARLAEQQDVEYAQASYVVRAHYRPNDPLYDRQWNLQSIGMEQAWDIQPGATSSVVVAVLDSGIAFQNAIYEFTADAFTSDSGASYPALGRVTIPFAAAPELAGSNRFVSPRDFIWEDDAPVDMDGHGTHVAGTIGQLTNNNVGLAGMAFNVRLMPVKIIAGDWDDIFGSPRVGTDDVVARGIRYAADNGAKVINMSIGRDGPPAPVVGDAMRYAVSRGVFIAVSAGNDYDRGNPVEAIAKEAAPIAGAMVVAAVGQDLQRAYYSGVQDYVEIAAPGGNSRVGGSAGAVWQQTYDAAFTDVYDLPPSRYGAPRFDVFAYRSFQGTSMAAPHVSGLAALLYQQGITSPAAIEAAITRFATDKGPAGRDSEYGHGLINPRATLRGLGLVQ